jgi:hypothetical protein
VDVGDTDTETVGTAGAIVYDGLLPLVTVPFDV